MTLRPPADSDAGPLLTILTEPEVARWWVGYTPARIRDEILEPGHALVMEIDGRCAGAIFLYPNDDPEYLHVVIHLFLGAHWYGRRFGAEALAIVIAHLDVGASSLHTRPEHQQRASDPELRAVGLSPCWCSARVSAAT